MKKFLLYLYVLLGLGCSVYGQDYWGQLDDFVGYDGIPITDDIYTFNSDAEAEGGVGVDIGLYRTG
ncbi:MAG: hypothetical protein R2865_03460 [Deinococcales bacterium]